MHPPAEDAFVALSRSIAVRLSTLRQRAPFGALKWTDVHIQENGKHAELRFEDSGNNEAWVWLGERDGRLVGGYRVGDGPVSDEIKEGLRAVLTALGPTAATPKKSPAGPDARRA